MAITDKARSQRWGSGGPLDLFIWMVILLVVLTNYLEVIDFSIPFLTSLFFVGFALILCLKLQAGFQNQKDMRNFIYLGVLFWVLLDPLQLREGISDFRGSVVAEALVYVAVFLAAVSLGYQLPPSTHLTRMFSLIREPPNRTRLFRILILSYLVGAAPIIYYSGGSLNTFTNTLLAGYNWNVDPGWRRGALGSELDYLFTISFLILHSTPFLGLWTLKRFQLSPIQKFFLICIIVSVPLLYFFSGSRRLFAFFVLGSLFYLYNAMPTYKRKAWALLFAAVPILLLLAMQVQVQFRASGFYEIDFAEVETRLDHLHRDNIFYWMLTAVSLMPEQFPYTREIPFSYLFIHPIPRFLWPDKPISVGFPFVAWDDVGSSLTVSIIGEFYIAQGLFGVAMAGLVYGWAARNWDQLIELAADGSLQSLIYYMGGVLFFVVGIRSFAEIVTQWYSVAFVVLLAYVLTRRERLPRAQGVRL